MAQHQRTLPYRPSTRPGTTSATQTQTGTPLLRLRASHDLPEPSTRPRIHWAEDVVDNEGMGRKKSKVCCIYHAPRPVGESSSESSSDSSSDSEGDGGAGDDGKARMGGKGKGKRNNRDEKEGEGSHDHEHDGCKHSHQISGKVNMKVSGATGKKKTRNVYETQPKPSKGDKAVEVNS